MLALPARSRRLLSVLTLSLASAVPAWAQQCPPDPFEPNDDCATAVTLPLGLHTGLTVPDGGADVFRVTVPAGQRLVATVSVPNSTNLLGFFRILEDQGPSGTCSFGDAGLAFGFVELGVTQLTLAWSASATAPATFLVRFDTFFMPCTTYDLDLTAIPEPCLGGPPDAFEPNSDCGAPSVLPLGLHTGLDVAIAERDYYSLVLQPGELVSVAPVGLSNLDVLRLSAWDLNVTCGDPSAVAFGTTVYGSGLQGLHLFNPGATPRPLVLEVAPVPDQESQTGFCLAYGLDVQSQIDPCGVFTGDPFEPNDFCGAAAPLSGSQSGLSLSRHDFDWFEVQVPPRSTVRLLTTSTGTGESRLMMLHSGCSGSTAEFLASSAHVYSDSLDPRQFLTWTNHTTTPFTTRLRVGSPNGGFANGYCDTYDLDLDLTLGQPFCRVERNSTGEGARLVASGSTTPGVGALVLSAGPLPANRPGMLLMSRTERPATIFGQGFLCLAAPIVRLPITTTGSGTLVTTLDWTGASAAIALGDVWSFQAWFRDPVPGALGVHTSEGLRLSFP
jgi:hypothetical protein